MNNKNVENPAERSFLSESITPMIVCMNVRVTMDMISLLIDMDFPVLFYSYWYC